MTPIVSRPKLEWRVRFWEKLPERPGYNLHYKWKDTYEILKRLSDGPGSPFEGVALEYVNPVGGHTMPTLSCGIQMLRRGETTQTHRHNSSTIYHAFRGSGTTVINGEKFDWNQRSEEHTSELQSLRHLVC